MNEDEQTTLSKTMTQLSPVDAEALAFKWRS